MENISALGIVLIFLYCLGKLISSVRMVPTQTNHIVERLGKYSKTLQAGFHLLIPFIDYVAFVVDLREETILVEPQECFTKDNVRIHIDGVIYLRVIDPLKACYGIEDYKYGAIQLAKTTTRAVVGTMTMDKTFEERDAVNRRVLDVFAEVQDAWGIVVTRYEVKNIEPPHTVKNAMEQQMAAEREKRAIVARSEGIKQARINDSEGKAREMINKSEGEMTRRINEAQGKAEEIDALATATATSIEKMADALVYPGGVESVKMRLYEAYLNQISQLAQKNTKIILPVDISNFEDLIDGLGLSSIGKGAEEAAEEIEKVVEEILVDHPDKFKVNVVEPVKEEPVKTEDVPKPPETPAPEKKPEEKPKGFTGLFSDQ